MSARGGMLAGFLGLTALEAIVSTEGASGRVASGLGALATIFRHLADPTIPAVPDRRNAADRGASTTTTGAPSAGTTTPGGSSAGAALGLGAPSSAAAISPPAQTANHTLIA